MMNNNRSNRYAKEPVSRRYVASGSRSSIPRVTLSSFGRSKFTWSLQEAWGEAEYNEYLAISQNQGWNPFRRLEYVNPTMRNLSQPIGKWLLKDDTGNAIAAAEVLVTETGFSRITVNLSLTEHCNTCDRFPEAFSYLISALFLITSSDLIQCFVQGGEVHKFFKDLDLATLSKSDGTNSNKACYQRTIMAVRSEVFVCDDDWSIPLSSMNVWEISQNDWWLTELAKKDRDDLRYLQKRIENDQMREGLKHGSRKRRSPFGLFAKLFSWR